MDRVRYDDDTPDIKNSVTYSVFAGLTGFNSGLADGVWFWIVYGFDLIVGMDK